MMGGYWEKITGIRRVFVGVRPRRIRSVLACVCLVALGSSFAGEPKKGDLPSKPKLSEGTPAEQVKALAKQFDDAKAAFLKRYEAAEGEAAKRLLLPSLPDPNAYASLFVRVAERHPKDPAALDALLW